MGIFDIFSKKEKNNDLEDGLKQSKDGLLSRITKAIAGKSTIDITVLDNLEEALVSSDVGLPTTIKIIDRVEARAAKDKYTTHNELERMIREEIAQLITENSQKDLDNLTEIMKDKKPYILMVVGVNGAGKTTTIGKLANQFHQQGKKVVLGAADTFRAAAVDQLEVWAKRANVEMVRSAANADPASVAFQAVEKGMADGADVIIIDTAGRLHNRIDLMNELAKINRVIEKLVPDGPHDVMLVLDGSTGQNAIEQAKHFTAATKVSCLAITKLDGTAKGGVVIGIIDQFKIPVRFIGVGESIEKLKLFNAADFVNSMLR